MTEQELQHLRNDGLDGVADYIAELEKELGRAETVMAELHEQVYDNTFLDNRVKLYFALKEQGE